MSRLSPGRRRTRWARTLINSLSVRLFLWIFGVIIVAFAAYASFSIRATARELEQMTQFDAQRFSDLIQDSTHHSMLLNRKDDVHHIIRAIAAEPGVVGVRIYDKNGAIIYSADEDEIGSQVDLRAEACIGCHRQDEPLQSVPASSRSRIIEEADGARTLGLINPIENAPECSSAACHAHPPDQSILGVLDVKLSMVAADARISAATRDVLVAALLTALLVGACSAVFISRVVRRPVHALIAGARHVARGDLETRIEIDASNEIGQLASAFNAMTEDLHKARREVTDWSETLEERLERKTQELSRSQRQVAHMDKMASLGKLAATVAHELNNPLAGILNYAKLVGRTLDESAARLPEHDELNRYLGLIQREASRSGSIVRNLLAFAKRTGTRFEAHALNEILERAAMLVRHHVEMQGIRLELALLEGDDAVACDGDQIQQALVALLVNAVEAMPNGGVLGLAATPQDDRVCIVVSDTGVGIPDELLPRIFEPFFSSKDDGGGAGLGLAVAYGIVQRHGGQIDVESAKDRGTVFRLLLPRTQPESVSPEQPVEVS